MTRFVGLDVSQKLTSICVVGDAGRRLWRGRCHTDPEQIERTVRGHAGDDGSPHATNCTKIAHKASKPNAIPVAVM